MAKKPQPTTATKQGATHTSSNSEQKRSYLRQSDVPIASLSDAIRVPSAIIEHYAGKPTAPFGVAKALNVDPKGSQLRVLTGAAIAFGLIEGGAQATTISVTDLARRLLRPKQEGEDIAAQREAVLKPRVFGEFLRAYDGNQFPREDIGLNVLEGLGVPRAKAKEVFERIVESARQVGFVEQLKGKLYVQLSGTGSVPPSSAEEEVDDPSGQLANSGSTPDLAEKPRHEALAVAFAEDQRRKRVFVTHGKDRGLVEPIKKLLEYGELEAVVSVERQSVSKPVPEKILDDMRKCGAAIIHVDAEGTIKAPDGTDHAAINPNVLIEIGAAMAFYGRRFILLVREGVKLPSNLQGLYEVRYPDQTLDANATIKLLEAMKDIKNYELPNSVE